MTHQPPDQRAGNAPRLVVPEENIISVEHPCIVKNADKAIDMIGGPAAIAQAVQDGSDKIFALSFRPQDPTSKTIIANKKPANNVLLRITVPRRTGRKRKRGTNDPWMEDVTDSTARNDASHLVHAMAANVNSYKVTALSTIPSMQMWRSMPDFVYSTSQIPMLQNAKETLVSQHYPTVKEFKVPRTYGIEDTTTLPPPLWSNQNIPQNYTYRQNPSVKVSHDPITGQSVIGNSQAPPKTYTFQIAWDDVEYPKSIMPGITPLGKQTPINQETVAALQKLFEERPIWSRRAMLNCLPSHLSSFNVVRFCIGYVAYAIRSGPWRDTLVRLGLDPRTDPKYRFYQTIMLQLVPRSDRLVFASGIVPRKTNSYKPMLQDTQDAGDNIDGVPTSVQTEKMKLLEHRKTFQRRWTGSDSANSHIFDGQSPLPPDGKVWQLCDFTDPQLAALRDIPELHIRATCESRYFGWYENGTNAKIRVALKAKVESLAEGVVLDPKLLEGFMLLPEKLGFEVDTNATVNTITTFAEQAEGHVGDTQTLSSTTQATTLNSDTLSAYLGNEPTTQQLSWAAAYRAFAKTGLGSVPASGASGKGRLTKSKPLARKSLVKKRSKVPGQEEGQNANNNADDQGTTQDQPIDVDAAMGDANAVNEGEEDDEVNGQDMEEGEEVLPSIEVNGFDVEADGDSELGLDDEEPYIKVEDSEAQIQVGIEAAPTGAAGPERPGMNDGVIAQDEGRD